MGLLKKLMAKLDDINRRRGMVERYMRDNDIRPLFDENERRKKKKRDSKKNNGNE